MKKISQLLTIRPCRRFCLSFLSKQVTVEDSKTGEEVTFSCQRWFSTSDGDGKISRELVRDDEDEETAIVSQGKDNS